MSVARKWPTFDFRIFLLPGGGLATVWILISCALMERVSRMVLSDWRRLYEDPGLELPPLMPRGFEAVVRAGIAARGSDAHRRSLAFWQGRRKASILFHSYRLPPHRIDCSAIPMCGTQGGSTQPIGANLLSRLKVEE